MHVCIYIYMYPLRSGAKILERRGCQQDNGCYSTVAVCCSWGAPIVVVSKTQSSSSFAIFHLIHLYSMWYAYYIYVFIRRAPVVYASTIISHTLSFTHTLSHTHTNTHAFMIIAAVSMVNAPTRTHSHTHIHTWSLTHQSQAGSRLTYAIINVSSRTYTIYACMYTGGLLSIASQKKGRPSPGKRTTVFQITPRLEAMIFQGGFDDSIACSTHDLIYIHTTVRM